MMNCKTKITLALMVFILTTLLATPALASQFYDLKEHWAAAEITQMVEQKAMKGYIDGNFHPDKSITRRELSQAILTLFPAAMDIDPQQIATYPDYPDLHNGEGQEFLKIAAMLLPGYTDGYFKPDEPASRQDVVALALSAALIEADKYKLEQNMLLLQFTIADERAWRKLVTYKEYTYLHDKYKKATAYWQDDPDKNNFYQFASYFYHHLNPVALLVGHNIINGFADNTLGLNKQVTRAETAVMLSRILSSPSLTDSDKYMLESASVVHLPQVADGDSAQIKTSFSKLGKYYQEKYKDPSERAKMLYNLILYTFGYDWETRQGLKDYTFADLPNLINTGLGTDAGLTAYYIALAKEAGLKANEIKGQSTNNGDAGEHVWVEIETAGLVIPVDPTYGVCTGAVFFNNFQQWHDHGYSWEKSAD